jgi:hypothetical protein
MKIIPTLSGARPVSGRGGENSMKNQLVLQITVLVSIPLLCFCASVKQGGEQKASTSQSKAEEGKKKVSISELKQLYEAATSEHERRAVCLRAIDEGVVHRGGPVASLDAVFGTHFAQELPTSRESLRIARINFGAFTPSPVASEAAVGWAGWYLQFEYDTEGAITKYHLSNLHK